MRRSPWLFLGLIILATGRVVSQEDSPETNQATSLSVEKAVMAQRVENREPVGEATEFPAGVGEIACWSRIAGAQTETYVQHVWIQGDTERARVQLQVKSPSWRTWSTKTIDPSWTGAWTLKIEDADGNVLETLSFTIE